MSKTPRQKQSLRRVIDNPRAIVYTHDLSGNFTFLSKAGERISGYSCEELRRMNVTQIVAPELAGYVREQIAGIGRQRFGRVYEVDIITKDGRSVALEVSTEVIVRDGCVIEIQGVAAPSVLRQRSSSRRSRCVDEGFFFG